MAAEEQNDKAKAKTMTVLGPFDVEDTLFGPVMMYEKIISNPASGQSMVTSSSDNTTSSRQVPFTMENLSEIRSSPFQYLENMLLNSENEACREIRHLSDGVANDVKVVLLDMTTAKEGRDHKACQRISQQLGIHLLIGTTCPTEHPDMDTTNTNTNTNSTAMDGFQRNMEHMERELKYGIGTRSEDDYKNLTSPDSKIVRCSFCGPMHISEGFPVAEQNELKAYAAVQGGSNAPLVLVAPSLTAVSGILDFVTNSGGIVSKTIVAHADLLLHRHAQQTDMTLALQILLEQVLDRGAIVCFDSYSVSACAFFDFDQDFPTLASVVDTASNLLSKKAKYAEQIVLSAGIMMKLQLKRYGGVGYPVVLKELVPRLKKKEVITSEHIELMLNKNPRRLLQWWVPPPTPEVPKYYLTCSICKKKFEPIMGEYFSKYTFVYCGTKCLRKHRKVGFKPLEEAEKS
ncbi:unnamed protein product [Cylindrotheca closterium]|uniref:Vms1-associating treble clef domain-containing protein n=1 Tax=Cylindrotheca closterium TaxID=2856 RepID=A0AAD2FTA9_9STRA|nr:unnamed protein product [Cylindrotheca closterium]